MTSKRRDNCGPQSTRRQARTRSAASGFLDAQVSTHSLAVAELALGLRNRILDYLKPLQGEFG